MKIYSAVVLIFKNIFGKVINNVEKLLKKELDVSNINQYLCKVSLNKVKRKPEVNL